MNIRRLGIFVTVQEREWVKSFQNNPLMYMTNPEPPGPGVPHAVPMFTSPQEAVSMLGRTYMLGPDVGLDLQNGEFFEVIG